jgi:ABC-type multidrug transport system ATPase subunit
LTLLFDQQTEADEGERVSVLRIERLATGLIGPVSFDVPAGTCATLMGASGSGKSLLLRTIVDLDPNTGSVWWGKLARGEMPATDWRKLVALVPAQSGWWSDHVRDHFPPNSGAEALLEALGVRGALDWDVGRLSTGERQRLAIARAICRQPRVLLLDEPTASLDEHATRQVEDLVRRCCSRGMAALMVTHDRGQASRLAGQRLIIIDGRVEPVEGSGA